MNNLIQASYSTFPEVKPKQGESILVLYPETRDLEHFVYYETESSWYLQLFGSADDLYSVLYPKELPTFYWVSLTDLLPKLD